MEKKPKPKMTDMALLFSFMHLNIVHQLQFYTLWSWSNTMWT